MEWIIAIIVIIAVIGVPIAWASVMVGNLSVKLRGIQNVDFARVRRGVECRVLFMTDAEIDKYLSAPTEFEEEYGGYITLMQNEKSFKRTHNSCYSCQGGIHCKHCHGISDPRQLMANNGICDHCAGK
jgi:hypothetical protein